jgi:hypothetical protein
MDTEADAGQGTDSKRRDVCDGRDEQFAAEKVRLHLH